MVILRQIYYLLLDILFILSPFPCLIVWICGGFYISNPTLKRFLIFHFILPFILCGFIIIHFYYLHYLSSNNSLGYNINNKILFFPFIFIKDIFGLFIVITLYIIQLFQEADSKLPFHLYYNLQLIYWHFIELLWLFIYTILYSYQ